MNLGMFMITLAQELLENFVTGLPSIIPELRPLYPYMISRQFISQKDKAHNKIRELLLEIKAEGKPSSKFADILMNSEFFTDLNIDQLVDEAIVIYLAGTQTQTHAICNMILNMGIHKEEAAKVRSQLREVFTNCDQYTPRTQKKFLRSATFSTKH